MDNEADIVEDIGGAGYSSVVERRAHDRKVSGSIATAGQGGGRPLFSRANFLR